jgi:uncharacterized NAD(P)/FAD-binding protein YdhS
MVLSADVIVGGAVAVGAAWGFWKWLDSKMGKKADKHSVNNDMQSVRNEQLLQRGYFKDVFANMEQHARRDEELFREVMSTMHTNHSELLRELGKKADR